jgi:hypothetical protein
MHTGATCASRRRSPLCTKALPSRHGCRFSLDTCQRPPYSQAHTSIRAAAERCKDQQADLSGDYRCGQPGECATPDPRVMREAADIR